MGASRALSHALGGKAPDPLPKWEEVSQTAKTTTDAADKLGVPDPDEHPYLGEFIERFGIPVPGATD